MGCGCEFDVHDEEIKPEDSLPSISIDYENIDHECPQTWELIGSGNTKGVFQLESSLGKGWSKKLEPWNIEELSALISIIRPGTLRAILDGKSLTQHYVDRKHDREPTEYLDPALEKVLDSTYGVLCYQEQAMRIAQELAGFNLQEADVLRKAIGKKKADVMAKCEKTFMEGCKKTGVVSEEKAKEIFGWIRESQKYSFNKSHGYGYGEMGYWSAYAKAHFPLHFFTSWLHYSHEKQKPQEEVRELINEASLFEIDIFGPRLEDISRGDTSFSMSTDGVSFGIKDVKKIGKNHVIKFVKVVREYEEILGPIQDWTWEQFLVLFSNNTTKTVVTNLILVGAMDCYEYSRKEKLDQFKTWNSLTKREHKGCVELMEQDSSLNLTSLFGSYLLLDRKEGGPHTEKRAKIIQDLLNSLISPMQSLEDTPAWINRNERELLGVSLTCSQLDACQNLAGNTTCKEFISGKGGDIILGVEILSTREYTIKAGQNRGKKMLFLSAQDNSACLDSVIAYTEVYNKNKNLLYEGNTVILFGKKSTRDSSFIINKVKQLT